MTSAVIDQLTRPAVSSYLCNKYNLTLQEICLLISDQFAKKNKSNATALQYYYDNRNNPDYQDKLRTSRNAYYNNNKTKLKALHLAKYANDPIFREHYQRYQALYSQKHRIRNIGETRGRPRKYAELETIKTSVSN
jgi:hypothetical protein